MKVLLLCPKFYTLAETLKQGFIANNCAIEHYDYREDTKSIEDKIHTHIRKLPLKIRSKWYRIYVTKITKRHLEVFHKQRPDLVLVYNSEMLLPDTVEEMKKSAKVCFFLGDSPFYTPTNDFFMSCLMKADHIFCADTGIQEQLKITGLLNVHFFLVASNSNINYKKAVSSEEMARWGSDLVFVGSTYSTSAGFKRAMFLNQFSDLDIKIYTSRSFKRWYSYFPKLEKNVIHPEKRISDEELNTILNCCKLYPVDANPGMINGIHLRIMDCIASGILPLAEYRKDVKDLFGRAGLPIIDNYKKAEATAQYYLDNDKERKEISSSLATLIDERYSPEISIASLMNIITER